MMSEKSKASVFDHYGRFKQCIGFLLTLRCPLQCAHCVVESGPERSEEMETDQAIRWLEDIGRYGEIKVVCFTGGEPFLNRRRLRALLAVANDYALMTSVISSASWASTYEQAVQVLKSLPALANLSLSADKYHLDFLPLSNVKNAAQAAVSLGIEVSVFVCLENEHDRFLTRLRLAMGEELYTQLKLVHQYVHLAGRAAQSPAIVRSVTRVSFEQLPELGCPVASAPIVLPDGRVMACCGSTVADPHNWSALTIGNLHHDSIPAIFARADSNCLIHALRVMGPKALAQIATEQAGQNLFNRFYERNSICDICRDVCTNPQVVSSVTQYLDEPGVAIALALARLQRFGEETPLERKEAAGSPAATVSGTETAPTRNRSASCR